MTGRYSYNSKNILFTAPTGTKQTRHNSWIDSNELLLVLMSLLLFEILGLVNTVVQAKTPATTNCGGEVSNNSYFAIS